MATYTYQCMKCGERFEVVQSMKDDALNDCPHCKTEKTLERIVSPAGGFRIHGKGVYKQTSRFD